MIAWTWTERGGGALALPTMIKACISIENITGCPQKILQSVTSGSINQTPGTISVWWFSLTNSYQKVSRRKGKDRERIGQVQVQVQGEEQEQAGDQVGDQVQVTLNLALPAATEWRDQPGDGSSENCS